MPLLEVHNLTKSYGKRRVVNGVSFHVDRGEVVGLLGPNGAGKTTTFRMTIGMLAPESGRVIFAGHDVTNWPMYRRARLGMGYLSQESSVFRRLTTEQNLLAILEAMPPLRSLGRRLTRKERWQVTERMLQQFDLLRVRKSPAWALSGGEKRRLEIARCLITEPLLILLDEPFTGIDPITIGDIQNIVRKLRDQGIGILLTDHNVREALKITDRSYVIADGVVEAHGTPQEIIRHPRVIAKYLGKTFQEPLPTAPQESSQDEPVQPSPKSPTEAPQDSPLPEPITIPHPRSPTHARPTAGPAALTVLQQERLRQRLEGLMSEQRSSVEQEFLEAGAVAVPVLLEALERRDPELRQRAWQLLQRIVGQPLPFDAFAPEAERRRALTRLREQFFRLAG
ncbi:MAG: LPS export ABC transporter ATP-binding protein [Gemmatales bacterium]|nr:LPS export ABC transporter ATP-binding protein [Gemmatales bacterium]MDW7995181.1 LPS export ABC transporter ATP-binding protein [Gemmatales bacterium]